MDLDDPNMIWEKRLVGRPRDTHFANGGSSPLAFSDETNLLETQAFLGRRVEDDEEDEESPDVLKLIVGIGLAAAAVATVVKAGPPLVRWFKSRQAAKKVSPSSMGTAPGAADTDFNSSVVMDSAAFKSEVDIALEEHRRSMSSAEAQRRLVAILVAAAFIADQMRELSGVRIDDDVPKLQEVMDKLSAPQLTASLNRMLEADASALDPETAAELLRAFGGGSVVEGDFVPLRNDKVKDALRLRQVA